MSQKTLFLFMISMFLFACKQDRTSNSKETQTEANDGVDQSASSSDFVLRNLSGQTAQDVIWSKTISLLDVRTYEELLEDPRIPGARNFDFNKSNFREQLEKLDKTKPWLVYCASGIRSAKACEIMDEMGFLSLYNLEGGYNEYKAGGYLDY